MGHTIKDSGERRQFVTGAQRDRGNIKPRPDLIHPYFNFRFGMHLAKGAVKYDPWNWYKGMPLSDWYASLCRHVNDVGMMLEDEDHLSAVCFNAMGFMITQEGIRLGIFPPEFDDMPDHSGLLQDLFLTLSMGEEIADENRKPNSEDS